MMRSKHIIRALLIAGMPAALAIGGPANAATVLTGAGVCNQTSTTTYSNCVAYSGNLLDANDIGAINTALDAVTGTSYPDVLWSTLEPTKAMVSGSGSDATGTITFTQALLGDVILGVHFGASTSGAVERTQFYLFNFTTPTTTLSLNTQGFSDAVFINGAVPEPASWALMLLGFGGIGLAMRRRRRNTALMQIA